MKTTRARRIRRAALFAVSAVSVAASGNPSSRALPWPSIGNGTRMLSLVPSQSQVTTDFAAAHHCSFWAAG